MNYKFVLVDTEGGYDKAQWVLSLPVTVGRGPTAEIMINDISISRRHCQFLIDPHGSLMVRDLGSKNGVFVDERRVDKAVVYPGTTVRLGAITLRPELTEEELAEEEEMSHNSETAEVFDLGETQPMKIVTPEKKPPEGGSQ